MEAQQLHGLTELIAANSNSMLMSPGAPGPPQSMSQPAVSIQEPAIENKQQTSQGVMKRSHGPSMDRSEFSLAREPAAKMFFFADAGVGVQIQEPMVGNRNNEFAEWIRT
eukprot:2755887-Rhodomonas_salina.1